jgi:Cupin
MVFFRLGRVEEGGWTHEVTQVVLPSSKDIAGVNMRLTAGSYRELHRHTADEWAYLLSGKARVAVVSPDGKMFIGDVGEGDLWLFRRDIRIHDIVRFIYLMNLLDTNETLFYHTLME